MNKIGSKALIPNAALKPLEILVGNWKITGKHPYLPSVVLSGRTSFEWIEGGAFLLTRSELDESQFPHGISIFGSDDASKEFFMLYFDSRGVSRKYDVSIAENEIKWWREDPSFSQYFTLTIETDGMTMNSRGEMSRDGGAREEDLSLSYTRVS